MLNDKSEHYPGKIFQITSFKQIVWVGSVYEHLYCILNDGTTLRLDKNSETRERYWQEVATIPLEKIENVK